MKRNRNESQFFGVAGLCYFLLAGAAFWLLR